jgi:hypothetical protein
VLKKTIERNVITVERFILFLLKLQISEIQATHQPNSR